MSTTSRVPQLMSPLHIIQTLIVSQLMDLVSQKDLFQDYAETELADIEQTITR